MLINFSKSVMCLLVTELCPTFCDPMNYQLPRLLCPRNSPGKNTRVGSHSLLQGIFLTQDQIWISCIASEFFTIWLTREAQFFHMWKLFVLLNIRSIFTTWFMILSIWTFSPGSIWIITVKPTWIHDYLLAVLITPFYQVWLDGLEKCDPWTLI